MVFNARKLPTITYERRKKNHNVSTPGLGRISKSTFRKTPITNRTPTANCGTKPIVDIFDFAGNDDMHAQFTSPFSSSNSNSKHAPTTNKLHSTLMYNTKNRKQKLVTRLRSADGKCKDMGAHNFDFIFSKGEDSDKNTDDPSTNDTNGIVSTDLHDRHEQLFEEFMKLEFGQSEKLTPLLYSPPSLCQTYVSSTRAPITYSRNHIAKVPPPATLEELYVQTFTKLLDNFYQ